MLIDLYFFMDIFKAPIFEGRLFESPSMKVNLYGKRNCGEKRVRFMRNIM